MFEVICSGKTCQCVVTELKNLCHILLPLGTPALEHHCPEPISWCHFGRCCANRRSYVPLGSDFTSSGNAHFFIHSQSSSSFAVDRFSGSKASIDRSISMIATLSSVSSVDILFSCRGHSMSSSYRRSQECSSRSGSGSPLSSKYSDLELHLPHHCGGNFPRTST